MKKVILISLMVAGMVSAVFASESLDAESAAMDQALFDSVAGEELSEVDMLAVEGEGPKNAIAYLSWYGGTGAVIGGILNHYLFGMPLPTAVLLGFGTGAYIGWNIGYEISDTESPDYRDMGFAWLDDEPWDSHIPVVD